MAVFAAFTLASAPTAAAQEQLAASCEPDGSTGHSPNLVNETDAQTFTSALTGALTRAEIEVRKDPGTTGDFVVQIRTVDDSTGAPTNVVLASATVANADVPDAHSFLSVVFANPPTVVAGEQYAIAVSRLGAAASSWGPSTNAGNQCPGDLWFSTDGGQTWTIFSAGNLDVVFRVFVTPPPQGASLTCKGEQATRIGTEGNDEIIGTDGPDVIVALGGNDDVSSLGANDLVCGGAGRDSLRGGSGKDRLLGQGGKDTLRGQAGKDKLLGKGGRDKLNGGTAKDICKGGERNDTAKKCEVERSI